MTRLTKVAPKRTNRCHTPDSATGLLDDLCIEPHIQRKKGYWGIGLSLIAAFVFSSIPFAGSLLSETLLVFLSCLIMLNIAIAKDWFCSKPALGFILANLAALAGVLAVIFTYIESIIRPFGIGYYYRPNFIKALLHGSKLNMSYCIITYSMTY